MMFHPSVEQQTRSID